MPGRDKLLEDLTEKIGQRYRSQIHRALQYEDEKLLEQALRVWEEICVEVRRQGRDSSVIQDHMQRVHKLVWQKKGAQRREEPAPGVPSPEKGSGQSFLDFKKMFKSELQERCLGQGIDLSQSSEESRMLIRNNLDQILKERLRSIPDWISRKDLIDTIVNDVCGLGILDSYLNDPLVTEVLINGKEIFYERDGRIWPSDLEFESLEEVKGIIERMLSSMGRRGEESGPLLEGRMPDGSRVHIILPPVALDGPLIAIRKQPSQAVSLDRCLGEGRISEKMANFFRLMVGRRQNIFVTGGRGSGKTSLLNVLCSLVSDEERIITIEEVAELRLPQCHVVRLEGRTDGLQGKESEVSIQDLFRKALHMRPDRIVVGDCRGPVVVDLVQAMSAGWTGLMGVACGSSPQDLFARLEAMAERGDPTLRPGVLRRQLASGIDIVLCCSRLRDGSSRVTRVCEVLRAPEDGLEIREEDIYRYEELGTEVGEAVCGLFRATGYVPSFVEEDPELRRSAEVMGLFERGQATGEGVTGDGSIP